MSSTNDDHIETFVLVNLLWLYPRLCLRSRSNRARERPESGDVMGLCAVETAKKKRGETMKEVSSKTFRLVLLVIQQARRRTNALKGIGVGGLHARRDVVKPSKERIGPHPPSSSSTSPPLCLCVVVSRRKERKKESKQLSIIRKNDARDKDAEDLFPEHPFRRWTGARSLKSMASWRRPFRLGCLPSKSL